jgi:ElaA protein
MIGRVCVSRAARGTGLGKALIEKAVEIARDTPGVRRAKLGAQVQALGFYEKLGFAAFGPVYDDAGIDHRDMVLEL